MKQLLTLIVILSFSSCCWIYPSRWWGGCDLCYGGYSYDAVHYTIKVTDKTPKGLKVTTLPAKAGSFLEHGALQRTVQSHWPRPGQESACEYVPRGVLVSVQDQPTIWARVRASAEQLGHDYSTPRTALASSCGIHSHNFRSGAFGLVAKDVHEAGPASIGDRTRERAVLDHVGHDQALHSDQPVQPDQFQSHLVVVFPSKVRDVCMNTSHLVRSLATILPSSFTTANNSLRDAQGRKFSFEVSRIFNAKPVGRSQERFEPNVDTHGRQSVRWYGDISEVTRKNHVPFVSFALEGSCLDRALDLAVDIAADHTDVLDPETITIQPDAVSVRRKFDTIVSVPAPEPRIPRFLARLATPKESNKGLVQAAHCSLGRGEVETSEEGVVAAQVFEFGRLVSVVDAASMRLVLSSALFKAKVVEPSVRLQHDLKLTCLVEAGIQPEFEGAAHLLPLLILDVTPDTGFGNSSTGPGEVASAPQRGQTRAQRRERGSQVVRRTPLKPVDQLCHASSWVGFNEQVNVIGHDLQGVDRRLQFGGDCQQHFTESLLNGTDENGAAVLGAPHQVKFQREDGTGVLSVSLVHKSIIHTPDTKSRGSGDALPLSPEGDSPRAEIPMGYANIVPGINAYARLNTITYL